ncbi:MAG: alpha-ketoacid dehydrogenase subunit beta [Sphingomonadales bacterium]
MAEMMLREAILQTIDDEMARDDNLIMLGEDIVGGMGSAGGPEAIGGIWGTSTGLFDKYGADRVIDTPISESAIVGAAAGAALTGKRAIAEIMFADFVGVCLDQIYNQIAKFRYMFGGKSRCPVTVRLTYGAGLNAAAQHSQAVYSMLTSIPGVKVVMPSTPADAKGLLTTAIRDDDPVLFFEHKALYGVRGDVPDGEYLIPFGHARQVREGNDVTIISCGQVVKMAEKAADKLAEEGIGCDVIDIRTASPLDEEAILDSAERTGRVIIAEESPPRCSLAADIAGLVADKAFAALRAPVAQVTAQHSPVPFARELERAYLPSPQKIEEAALRLMSFRGK